MLVATEARRCGERGAASDPGAFSTVLQPGHIPVEEAAPVSAALPVAVPAALRGPDPDGFCYAASDRKGDDPRGSLPRAIWSRCSAPEDGDRTPACSPGWPV